MNCTCGHSLFGHEAVPQTHLSGAPLTLSGRCESYGCMCGAAKPGTFSWTARLTPPKNQCSGGCGREVSSEGLCCIGCFLNARQREASRLRIQSHNRCASCGSASHETICQKCFALTASARGTGYPTFEALKNELAGIRLLLGLGPDDPIIERLRFMRQVCELAESIHTDLFVTGQPIFVGLNLKQRYDCTKLNDLGHKAAAALKRK